ncbi:MAG TPA: hypothetical protein VFV75_19635 [Candidatus Polarisedimenticolaceae bacterium]|nr:hypothetical protein [Candidatus Polarisedimenticolaceae bacterium]
MPVTWSLDGDLLQLDLEGDYAPTDIIDAFLTALADLRCPPEVSLLLDTTRSQSLDKRSPRQIRHVAQYLGPYRKRIRGRCAVVVGSDLQFGLSRMGSAYSDSVGVDAGVFRSRAEALEWLRG